MTILKKIGLALLCGLLVLLLLSGTRVALVLGPMGVLGLYIGLTGIEPDFIFLACVGLITVLLASVCCFTGLLRSLIMAANALMDKPRWDRTELIMTALAVVITLSMFVLLPCGFAWVLLPDALLAGLIVWFVCYWKSRRAAQPQESEVIA